MAMNLDLLKPQAGQEETFAIEALVFSTQIALQRVMNRKGVNGKELASRLGMSPARVSQIFSDKGANLTLKTIARIAHALGEDFEFVRKQDMHGALPEEKAKEFRSVLVQTKPGFTPSVWKERAANSSPEPLRKKLAA